ncbi:hypothetical protein ABZX98_27375 [Streptomyces sp. NPDC002992]|uniref:hypothetical protein n=1 Tax=Streptomyces sp. NPDC002992 TaxID=3154273 RepID=UPI0033B0D7E4
MDQGLAAALAGIAGVVGAGIGGLATAYGARVGAQKTIEAVHVQVAHQASAEHEQWTREHRRQVCDEAVAAWMQFYTESVPCQGRISRDQDISEEQITALHEAFIALTIAAAKLQLWGPDNLVTSAHNMSSAAEQLHVATLRWPRAVQCGDPAEVSAIKEQVEACNTNASAAWCSFASTAHTTLGVRLQH